MDSLVWYSFLASAAALVFGLVWGAMVMGVAGGMPREPAEAKHPNFSIKGKKSGIVAVAIMVVPMIYMIWTNNVDGFVYATSAAGFLLASAALLRGANSLGRYAFVEHSEWRAVRRKTCFQAVWLLGFVWLLERTVNYLEHTVLN